jgi:hypothetical protein
MIFPSVNWYIITTTKGQSLPFSVHHTAGCDFRLNTGSPLIGKGSKSIFALKKVLINPNFGVTEYSEPGT